MAVALYKHPLGTATAAINIAQLDRCYVTCILLSSVDCGAQFPASVKITLLATSTHQCPYSQLQNTIARKSGLSFDEP